jgi:hypothetical protein
MSLQTKFTHPCQLFANEGNKPLIKILDTFVGEVVALI